MFELGYTEEEISNVMNISERTVHTWLTRYHNGESLDDHPRSGRPSIISEEDKELIIGLSHEVIESKEYGPSKKYSTPRDINDVMQLDTSNRTIRRVLDRGGEHGRKRRKSAPLTEAVRAERVRFCRQHLHWPISEWMKVLAGDATIFPHKYDGPQWCQRRPNEEFLPENMAEKVTHPLTINAWGCISGKGQGTLLTFSETLDGPYMRKIMDSCVPESQKQIFPDKDWYFMHDNSPTFTARTVQDWIAWKKTPLIVMPPYSPDLNPIENLWSMLKPAVHRRGAKTVQELENAVHAEWDAVTPEYLYKIFEDMPVRCAKIIAADGYRIHH